MIVDNSNIHIIYLITMAVSNLIAMAASNFEPPPPWHEEPRPYTEIDADWERCPPDIRDSNPSYLTSLGMFFFFVVKFLSVF